MKSGLKLKNLLGDKIDQFFFYLMKKYKETYYSKTAMKKIARFCPLEKEKFFIFQILVQRFQISKLT